MKTYDLTYKRLEIGGVIVLGGLVSIIALVAFHIAVGPIHPWVFMAIPAAFATIGWCVIMWALITEYRNL